MTEKQALYGLMAEFASARELLEAAQKTRAAGYRKTDAFSPFPIQGLDEELGAERTILPLLVLLGGLGGGTAGFFMQWFANVIHYPLIIGARPYNSWPAFIPITFELTILSAAAVAVVGMIFLNGLPMPYHPVFNVERFQAASRDGFFLCIESRDARFQREETRAFLGSLGARAVHEVQP